MILRFFHHDNSAVLEDFSGSSAQNHFVKAVVSSFLTPEN
jgi:hypothetical protein